MGRVGTGRLYLGTVWAGSSPRPGEDPPAPSPACMQVGLFLESWAAPCPWKLGAPRTGLWASVASTKPCPFFSCSETLCLLAAPSHPQCTQLRPQLLDGALPSIGGPT